MKTLIILISLLASFHMLAGSFVPASFSTDYIKTYISATKKPVTQPGFLHYLYPGQLRTESNVATRTVVVINRETFWYYQGAMKGSKEPGEVKIHRAVSHPLIQLLDSIKDGLETSAHFTKTNAGFDVILTSKPDFLEESNIKEVVLKDSFKHSIKSLKDVKTLVITEVNNTVTTYEFKNFREEKFSQEHFVFKIPPNTKSPENKTLHGRVP